MENTIVFTVGALTMVLLAVASLAVLSTVMVLKLKEELRLTYKMIDDIYSTISHISKEQSREIEKTYNDADRRLSELQSYVDRRFDKLIDTYLLVKETEKESKEIIKG